MPKDFLQAASLTPTFLALMVKFGGKIGTLYQMLKNAFKKHPLQNRTNVQIKGRGVKGLFMFKNLHFSERMASLRLIWPRLVSVSDVRYFSEFFIKLCLRSDNG